MASTTGVWFPRGGPYSRLPYSDVRNTLPSTWGWTAFFDPVRPFKTKTSVDFASFVAPPTRVVWVPQQQTDLNRYKTKVSVEFASFVSPQVQAPWVQSYQTEQLRPKTKVSVEFSSFVSPLVTVPTGWEYKETVAPRQKPVIAEFSSFPLAPPTQVQAGISWGFGFIHPTLNAKLNIQVEFSQLPFLIAAVAPEEVQSTGDGPPWGLTGDEKRQLKKYYDELAALQEQYAEEHRANVQELLNDVRRAAGLTVDEIEEETGPVAALDLDEIRQRITELPQLPDRSLFSVNLRALQAKAAEDARIALEEDDEETLSILLLH